MVQLRWRVWLLGDGYLHRLNTTLPYVWPSMHMPWPFSTLLKDKNNFLTTPDLFKGHWYSVFGDNKDRSNWRIKIGQILEKECVAQQNCGQQSFIVCKQRRHHPTFTYTFFSVWSVVLYIQWNHTSHHLVEQHQKCLISIVSWTFFGKFLGRFNITVMHHLWRGVVKPKNCFYLWSMLETFRGDT